MMKKLILGALAFLFLGATAAAPAMAVTDLSPPWGNSPVNVYIGRYVVPTSPPAPTIVIQIVQWERRSDLACSAQQIGSAIGLSTDYRIHGTTGDDTLRVIVNSWTVCGKTINGLAYNGHYLDLYGGDGADYMTSWGGDTLLYGEAGDDDLYSENPTGRQEGGPGADLITYAGGGTGAYLLGGEGRDCLTDVNRTSHRFDCGANTDFKARDHYPVSPISCEGTIADCSELF